MLRAESSSLSCGSGRLLPHTSSVFAESLLGYFDYCFPSKTHFSNLVSRHRISSGLKYVYEIQSSLPFFLQWIKCMLYWNKLCGKVLIIPKFETLSIHSESLIFFSLFYNCIKLFTGENVHYTPFVQKIVIFYCIYLKQTGCFEIKKNKDHQIFQSNVVYFICIYFLLLTLEGQVKRVSRMLNSLPAWVMVLLFTPCPISFCRTKESVAIFYCNIPF